mgnify:CR=1 FL=1
MGRLPIILNEKVNKYELNKAIRKGLPLVVNELNKSEIYILTGKKMMRVVDDDVEQEVKKVVEEYRNKFGRKHAVTLTYVSSRAYVLGKEVSNNEQR